MAKKVKPPKGVVVTPELASQENGGPYTYDRAVIQVSGYIRPYTHEFVLRGMSNEHINHFFNSFKRILELSALRTVTLERGDWYKNYHKLFTQLANSALGGFVRVHRLWSPRYGYGETRQLHPGANDDEAVVDTVLFAHETGAPVSFLYQTKESKGRPSELRSYRVNVHSLRHGGFIGHHARGYRRFHFDQISGISVEGTKPLNVNRETLIRVKVTPGQFLKATLELTREPFIRS